jgi:hypothetical protein
MAGGAMAEFAARYADQRRAPHKDARVEPGANSTITSFFRAKGVIAMSQQGQLIGLRRTGRNGQPLWAYRYRVGGRSSKRVQRGGFASERDAVEALERDLERLRRERRVSRSLTVSELVDAYLAQHDVEQVTIEKLRWLLGKAVAAFGARPVSELRSEEIAAWRIALSPGYRFDATGVAAGACTRCRLGDDRRQPSEARRGQPAAAAQGAASLRVVGRTRTWRRGLSTSTAARDGREHAIRLLLSTS